MTDREVQKLLSVVDHKSMLVGEFERKVSELEQENIKADKYIQ